MSEGDRRNQIIEEAKRMEHDASYSAKGHYEAATVWNRVHLLIGIPTALLSALASASATNHTLLAGVLALVVAALSAIVTFLNPNKVATAHQQVGNRYNALRNGVHLFCALDVAGSSSEDEIVQHLKKFAQRRSSPLCARAQTGAQWLGAHCLWRSCLPLPSLSSSRTMPASHDDHQAAASQCGGLAHLF